MNVNEILDARLPPREPSLEQLVKKTLLTRHDLTYVQIAKALGCSKSRVRQVALKHGLARNKRQKIESGKNTTETSPNSQ